MPKIEPFRGILYNPERVRINNVIAPPYDVISPRMQDELYNESEYNIVRLILGKEMSSDSSRSNKYKRAKKYYNEWLRSGILVQDEVPAIYIYNQEYKCGPRKKNGWGFMARMKIEDPRTSRVLPHENTFAKPKQDRLSLVREVQANLSPIFTLFQDEKNKVEKIFKSVAGKKPLFTVIKDGVTNKFWRLRDELSIKNLQDLMMDRDIFIADGHHRYEVATIYREEMRKKASAATEGQTAEEKGYDYVMMYFAPISEEGLTVLATHRLLKGVGIDVESLLKKLKDYFTIQTVRSEKELFENMSAAKKDDCVFGIYFKSRPFYLAKLKKDVDLDEVIGENKSKEWKRLDVSILHGIIFDKLLNLKERISNEECVVYTRDPQSAINEVNSGNYEAVFFLNPTRVSQVRDIAKIGDKMPHKSTYFYPKLISGLVINPLA